MNNFASTALLLAGFIVPVALFWRLKAGKRVSDYTAAAIAVAIGWALNIAWATVATPTQGMDNMSIATKFGWFCPTALVAITWLVLRVKNRRK